jgi:hypothetical protein
MDSSKNQQVIVDFITAAKALPCWNVNCGGAVGTSFSLDFGKRIPRRVPRYSDKRIIEVEEDYGEVHLLVWCAWRLDAESGPLTSSDDSDHGIKLGLSKLIGTTVETINAIPPAWDMTIWFSNGLSLKVFCDHVPGDPSIHGNWDFFLTDKSIHVGPGATYNVTEADNAAINKPTDQATGVP